jgi:hypothetical protein
VFVICTVCLFTLEIKIIGHPKKSGVQSSPLETSPGGSLPFSPNLKNGTLSGGNLWFNTEV